MGAQCSRRRGDWRLERLEPTHRRAPRARRRIGNLGGIPAFGRSWPRLQVRNRGQTRLQGRRQSRSVCIFLRSAASAGVARVAPRLFVEGCRLACRERRAQCIGRGDLHLRGASRLMASRRRWYVAQLPRGRRAARRICHPPGLHPRRADADHRASVFRIVGLPDHGLLRADGALRHAAGLHEFCRYPARPRDRRAARLGAFSFPERRARPRLLRRLSPVRAFRPPPRLSPRVEEPHLQLRPPRSSGLSPLERDVLARPVSRRRDSRGRRRFDALSRLRAQAGGMGPQRARRQREPRSGSLPAGLSTPRSTGSIRTCRPSPRNRRRGRR